MLTSLVVEFTMTPIAPDATHAAATLGFGVGVAAGVGVTTAAAFSVDDEPLSPPHAAKPSVIPRRSAIIPSSRGRLKFSDITISPRSRIAKRPQVSLRR